MAASAEGAARVLEKAVWDLRSSPVGKDTELGKLHAEKRKQGILHHRQHVEEASPRRRWLLVTSFVKPVSPPNLH